MLPAAISGARAGAQRPASWGARSTGCAPRWRAAARALHTAAGARRVAPFGTRCPGRPQTCAQTGQTWRPAAEDIFEVLWSILAAGNPADSISAGAGWWHAASCTRPSPPPHPAPAACARLLGRQRERRRREPHEHEVRDDGHLEGSGSTGANRRNQVGSGCSGNPLCEYHMRLHAAQGGGSCRRARGGRPSALTPEPRSPRSREPLTPRTSTLALTKSSSW